VTRVRACLAIANPRAGGGAAREVLASARPLLEAAGIALEVRLTEAPGDAERIAREAELEPGAALVAVGGDGTLHEVVNGLMRRAPQERPPLGLLPAGSGNALARDLGLCARGLGARRVAAERLAAGERVRVDVIALRIDGRGEERHACNIVGWGLAAAAGACAERLRRLGARRYTWASALEALRARAVPAEAVLDGRRLAASALIGIACNSQYTGAGMRMAPQARLDDGQVDVLLVRSASRLALLSLLAKVRDGRHLESPLVEHLRASTFAVRLASAGRFNLDGEIVQARTLEARVLPGALELIGRLVKRS